MNFLNFCLCFPIWLIPNLVPLEECEMVVLVFMNIRSCTFLFFHTDVLSEVGRLYFQLWMISLGGFIYIVLCTSEVGVLYIFWILH